MGECKGLAVEALKAELERTGDSAKRPPINVEVDKCWKFIQRSEKRIQELDAERASEAVALKEAKDRLQRLEVEQAQQPDPNAHPVSDPETSRLQALVAQLQSELVQVAGPTPMTVDIPSCKRARLREDFVPSCVEEMQQWVWDRQQELQAAIMAGRPEEVGRISIRGAEEWHGVQAAQTTVGSVPCMLLSTVGLVVR